MTLWNDFRFALRQLRKNTGFSLVVAVTLGLCIGANTAVYSVLDAVLLRAAPYPQPERLALVTATWRENGQENVQTSQTGALLEGVRNGASNLDVAAYGTTSGVNFAAQGHLEYLRQQRVSAGFFRVLGVAPRLGREFEANEDVPGGPALVVLSYPFWRRVFPGDISVVGRAINLRGEPYTVVGVMPEGFDTRCWCGDASRGRLGPVDVWTPLRPSRTGEGGGSNYGVVARLQPGVSWAAAAAQLRALSGPIAKGLGARQGSLEEGIIPLQTGLTEDTRSGLLLTWAAVLAVLLIGCVNIAGLLMARSAARRREVATCLALGGGRWAIVRQLLVESLLLALAGCAVGLALGVFALDGLKRLGAENFVLWRPPELDARIFLVMLGISVMTSVLFGLAPALAASRVDLRAVLLEGGRNVAGGRSWPRRLLVAAEVALSLVLLVSAGLLVKTLRYLDGLKPGFDTQNVMAAEASLQDARYQTNEAVNSLFTRTLEQMRRIPGVQSAAAALTLPYERPLNEALRLLDGDRVRPEAIEVVYVTPGYFATMRIPLEQGRDVSATDTARSAPVAIVSESFAAKYYRGREPLGHHLDSGEIVGVVGDIQQRSGIYGGRGPLSIEPTVYVPVAQFSDKGLQMVHTWFSPKWVVRTSGPIRGLAAQIQSAVASVDSQLPIASVQSVDDLQGAVTRTERYRATLFSSLAGLAVLLAALGLYGLISQTVAQRTRELGVRLALGATPRQVMAEVLQAGVYLAAEGTLAGLALSLAAARLLRHFLWGVRPSDPVTLAISAALLLAIAVAAAVAPAARILRLDPAQTLRDE